MGWLKSLGRLVGRGVEKVGDFLGSSTLKNIGRGIQDACAEKIASEKSYDKHEANIYTTERLSNTLSEMSAGYLEQATLIEKSCIHHVESYFEKLISMIKEAGGSSYNKANLNSLERGKGKIAKMIEGGIREPLSKRLSIDDSECCSILKMDSGSAKLTAMKNFTHKVICGALDNLAKKVRESLNDITDDIEDYLSNISEEQEKEVQVLKQHIDKIVESIEQEQSNTENSCIVPMLVLNASEQVLSVLK